jgi:predicted nucleic acid-binding protein
VVGGRSNPVKLFLDANVLFTGALSPGGRSASLVALAEAGLCEILTSPHALTEARHNLALESPDASRRLEAEILPVLRVVAEAGPEAVRLGTDHGLPLKDAPILGAALQAGADVLVTGDSRHFGHLYEAPVQGMRKAPPAIALALLLRSSQPG